MSDDTIKRSDAIKALDNAWINGTSLLNANEAVKQLNDLPPADRPQGMWELVPCTDLSEFFEGVKNGFRFRCTNCKDERKRNKHDMNFCPNCGARMLKGADDA